MPIHHVKGQPSMSTYVREKGVSNKTVIMRHPVVYVYIIGVLRNLCLCLQYAWCSLASGVKERGLFKVVFYLTRDV